MSMSDPRGIRNRPRKPWRRVDSRLARAGTRCAILIEICRVWRLICICKTQAIRARPFDQHRVWNRTNSRSLLPASDIEGGARSSKRTQRWAKWGRRYGGEPIVSGWTVVCVPHAGIMHGHLGLRGKAMHYRGIPEGLGWVGRRLLGMHRGPRMQ